jgi:hypothetical protein
MILGRTNIKSIYFINSLATCGLNGVANNCNRCLSSAHDDCVWCIETQSCVPNSTIGICRNFFTNPMFCPVPCNSLTSCADCTNGGCIWCDYPTKSCTNDPQQSCQYTVEDPQFCPNNNNKISFN